MWFILMSCAVFIYHVLKFLWGLSEGLPVEQGSCGVDPVPAGLKDVQLLWPRPHPAGVRCIQ